MDPVEWVRWVEPSTKLHVELAWNDVFIESSWASNTEPDLTADPETGPSSSSVTEPWAQVGMLVAINFPTGKNERDQWHCGEVETHIWPCVHMADGSGACWKVLLKL